MNRKPLHRTAILSPSLDHRRGTVLIFVVGILVLLALAATAYLSTARVDRVTTKQTEFNTQVDLLLEGVRQATISAILDDPSVLASPNAFLSYDYPLTDQWLASRVPVPFNLAAAYDGGTTAGLGTNPGMWPTITGPFITGRFESPTGQIHGMRNGLVPFGIYYNGRLQPVLSYDTNAAVGFQPATGTNLSEFSGNYLYAGDADGDGIADSGSQKLPVGRINGVEYYVYIRVTDNGSAVNAETAMSRDFDFTGDNNQTLNTPSGYNTLWKYGFFTTDIGLAEHLRDYTLPTTPPATTNNLGANFMATLQYRLSGVSPSGLYAMTPAGQPQADSGPRNDFYWLSLGDALHHQMNVRLENLGFVDNANQMRRFGITDTTALARRFILVDPLGATQVENTLANSLLTDPVGTIPSTPYAANDSAQWFDRMFRYDLELYDNAGNPRTPLAAINFKSRRPLIVTESNTRALIPADAPLASTILPFDPAGTPKSNINTATVQELFRSFHMVFLDPKYNPVDLGNVGTVYPAAAINAEYAAGTQDPYKGMRFDDASQDATNVNEFHPARTLRSPIRATPTVGSAGAYAGHVRIEAAQMAKLRAAIAAVNTDAMRRQSQPNSDNGNQSAPDIITPQDLPLVGKIGNTDANLTVRIFGISRQPFLTEVFAHNDQTNFAASVGTPNPNGYIALEFYNPHDFPIDLSNCRFATIMRHGPTSSTPPWSGLTPFPRMVMEDLTKTSPSNPGRTEMIKFLRDNGTNHTDGNGDGFWDIDPAYVKSNLDDPSYYTHPLIVPARGYLIMENFDTSSTPDATAATHRPGSVQGSFLQVPNGPITTVRGVNDVRPGVNAAYVRNLHLLFNREFVLMRPMGAVMSNRISSTPPPLPGSGLPAATPTLCYVAPAALATLARDSFMPLDSFDLSGLMLNAEKNIVMPGIADYKAWHYARQTPTLVDSDSDGTPDRWQADWKFVYPGRYDAAKSETATDPLIYSYHARQQGTNQTLPFPVPPAFGGSITDPWDTTLPPPDTGAAPAPAPSFGSATGGLAQDKSFTIQLFSRDWPGPKPPVGATGNLYPFGQFARVGDLLQVPFIGAYTIIQQGEPNAERVVEINSVTMDAMMAEDTDVNTDPAPADNGWDSREQIGRFVPLRTMDNAGNPYMGSDVNAAATAAAYGDYFLHDGTGSNPLYRYAFARRIFDYFTVQAPHEDGMPNAGAARYGYWNTGDTAITPITPGEAVSNSGLTANTAQERIEPYRGLININTAPYKVLAMVPWVSSRDDVRYDPASSSGLSAGSNGVNDNDDFARAFVIWRDGNPGTGLLAHGPITTLMDLYKVPAFIQMQATCLMGETNTAATTNVNREPGDREGDISPFDPTIFRANLSPTDGIRYDFEEQTLLVNRISNLVTTRSDTYTVYILLQGWRNAGTSAAELVVERRAAMVVDRSRYMQSNGNVTSIRVPTN